MQNLKDELNDDLWAACGALTPVLVQLLRINPDTFIVAGEPAFYAGFILKMIALIYAGIIYNRVFCTDTDIRKIFFNGMAAPAVMLAVIEPITKL